MLRAAAMQQLAGRTWREQKRGDRVHETVWVLPEEQMAQFWEHHELRARDAVREQLPIARVDDGVRGSVQDQRAGTDARLP